MILFVYWTELLVLLEVPSYKNLYFMSMQNERWTWYNEEREWCCSPHRTEWSSVSRLQYYVSLKKEKRKKKKNRIFEVSGALAVLYETSQMGYLLQEQGIYILKFHRYDLVASKKHPVYRTWCSEPDSRVTSTGYRTVHGFNRIL